jgi:glycosyltransferase involved in cell wall biosynthesis
MQVSRPLGLEVERQTDPIDREALRTCRAMLPPGTRPRVVIVIPAYNEAEALPWVLGRMPKELGGTTPLVLVVSDGSTDDTARVAHALGAVACETPINRGQGAALRLGYLIALALGAEVIGVVDADGQWDPGDLAPAIDLVLAGKADFVQGSRVLGASEVGDPVRDLGVSVFRWLISWMIGQRVTDTTSGLRVMSARIAARLRLDQPQYQAGELVISAAFAGATIAELPVVMTKRVAGHSKKARNVLYGWLYLRAVVRTWLRERWLAPL